MKSPHSRAGWMWAAGRRQGGLVASGWFSSRWPSQAVLRPCQALLQSCLTPSPGALPPLSSVSPVDGADTGHSVVVTDALGQEPVSDLPGKHGRVLPLVVSNLLHHLGGGYLGLGAPYHSRSDATSLVVPTPIENPKELPNKQVETLGRDLDRDSCSPLRERPRRSNGPPMLASTPDVPSIGLSPGICRFL